MTPPRTQSKKTSRAVSLSRAFVPLSLTISTPMARPRPRVSPTIERSSHSFTRFRAFPPTRAARSGIRSRRMISIVTVAATQAAGCPPKVVPATTSSLPMDRSSPRTAPRGKDDVVAGTTFGGHPAACVAATVTIDIMQRDRIPERAARIGGKALKRVKEWEDLAIGVEIVSDKGTKARDNEMAREVFFDCVRSGVIPLYDYEMNVLRIQPPLTIEEALLDKALDGMESALRKHAR